MLQIACPVLFGFGWLGACAQASGTDTGDGGSSSSSSGGGNGSSGTGSGSGGSGSSSGKAGSSSGTAGSSSGTGSGSSSGTAGSSSGNAGSSSSGGTASSSSGATASSSSSGGGGLDAGDGGYVCPNTDQSLITISPNNFVSNTCNQYNIQGAWYCFANSLGLPEDTCPASGIAPYFAPNTGPNTTSNPAFCLTGNTGASTGNYMGMGFELNATGGTPSIKRAYNATANSPPIIGFNVGLAGTSGGAEVRIGFTTASPQVGSAPFMSVALNGTTNFPVLFSQAVVPLTFMGDPGAKVDPTSIYDLQVEVVGGTSAAYTVCIDSISPIFANADGGTVAGSCSSLMTAGGLNCAAQAITLAGNYGIQNNETNATGQCVQATAGGPCSGFTASYMNAFGNAGNSAPSAYPSLIYGWQNGAFYGGYPTAKALSTIATAQSNWQFTVPGSGTWDVSYDTWFSPNAAPATANGGLELMVWPAVQGGKQPVGNDTGQSVNFPGGPWEIWTGSITVSGLGTWPVISYKRNSASSGTVSPDLAMFFNDALNRNVGLQPSWFLLGIQAGFEVWQQNASPAGNMVTNTFSVNVTTK